jgi:hypothetical protein
MPDLLSISTPSSSRAIETRLAAFSLLHADNSGSMPQTKRMYFKSPFRDVCSAVIGEEREG